MGRVALRALGCALALMTCVAAASGLGIRKPGEAGRAEPAAAQAPGNPITLPADIPVRRDPPPGAASSGSLSFVIVGVLMVGAAGLLWFVRRKLPRTQQAPWMRVLGGAAKGELKTLASTRLTPRNSLHVVQWRERRFLLACSEGAVSVVAEEPAGEGGKGPSP